jgi:hypothetical protein
MADSREGDDKGNDSQLEHPAVAEDDYERAMRRAFARMEKGFNLGGIHKMDRDALHERAALRLTDSL